MKIFEAMENRHSVRNYEPEILSETVKEEINTLCKGVKPFQQTKCSWVIMDDAKATGKIFTEVDSTKWEELVNYGFEGEQIILGLIQNGPSLNINATLWKASGISANTPAVLRFGKVGKSGAIGKLFKKITGAASERKLVEFIEGDVTKLSETAKRCFEMAILSPSALNRRPWSLSEKKLSEDQSELIVRVTKTSNLNALDFGIILSHVYLTLKELNKDFEYGMTDKTTAVFTISLL